MQIRNPIDFQTAEQQTLINLIIEKRTKADLLSIKAAQMIKPENQTLFYTEAHQIYIECHQLFIKFIELSRAGKPFFENTSLLYSKVQTTTVVLELYLTAKTIADSYFAQRDYRSSYLLYSSSYRLLRSSLKDSATKEWLNENFGDMSFFSQLIQFNAAHSILFFYEKNPENLKKAPVFSIDELQFCLGFFINLVKLSNDNKMGKLCSSKLAAEMLLRARVCFGKKSLHFSNSRHQDYLIWCMQAGIFTAEQLKIILTAPIESAIDFTELMKICSITSIQRDQIDKLLIDDISLTVAADSNDPVFFATQLHKFTQTEYYQNLKLKPHQKLAFAAVQEHFSKNNTVAGITMATGTGKTWIFLSAILALHHDLTKEQSDQNKILIVVPQLTLSSQVVKNFNYLHKMIRYNKMLTIEQYDGKNKKEGHITVITLLSLMSQMKLFKKGRGLQLHQYKLVIFDEAHEILTAKCKNLFEDLKLTKMILTFTATAEYNTQRKEGNLKSIEELIGAKNCIYHYSLLQGINDQVLAPLRICYVNGVAQIKRKARSAKKQRAEIGQAEILKQLENNFQESNATVIELYLNLKHPDTDQPLCGKKAFAFCISRNHANALAECFVANGVRAAIISGELPATKQNELLENFRQGKIQVLCNADILITGVDVPDVEILFNLRPTYSSLLAEQRLGRVTRLAPNKMCGLVFELIMMPEQVLSTEFIGKKQVAGNLPVLLASSVEINRSCVPHPKRINGACEWNIHWNELPKAALAPIVPMNHYPDWKAHLSASTCLTVTPTIKVHQLSLFSNRPSISEQETKGKKRPNENLINTFPTKIAHSNYHSKVTFTLDDSNQEKEDEEIWNGTKEESDITTDQWISCSFGKLG